MKKISLFLFVLLALAACAPAPLQTSEVSETSEVSPSSTPTPPATPTRIATATATPSALESGQGQALLGLGYEQAQLKEFTSFAEGEYSFPGDTVTYHGIIGTKADGSKEILAFKFSDNPNLIKLSGTEVVELSKQTCSAGACFSHSYFGPNREPMTDITAITTGIVLADDKKDEAGNIIASVQSALILTQNDDGHPRFIKFVVQVEDPNNPDSDLLNNNILNGFDFTTQGSTKVHSLEELADIFQKGIKIEFGTQSIKYLVGIVKGFGFFGDTFGSDPFYSSAFESFLSSHGTTLTRNDPILILSRTSKIK